MKIYKEVELLVLLTESFEESCNAHYIVKQSEGLRQTAFTPGASRTALERKLIEIRQLTKEIERLLYI